MKMLPKITPLLPCPFCDSAASHVTVSSGGEMGTKVRCQKCHVATRFSNHRAAGAKAWNKRAACSDDSRGLTARVVVAARKSAAMITKAHDGDESNIPDENELIAAVEALDRHARKL